MHVLAHQESIDPTFVTNDTVHQILKGICTYRYLTFKYCISLNTYSTVCFVVPAYTPVIYKAEDSSPEQ